MGVTSLPLEVLVKIFSCLDPKDIVNASLACKLFHRVLGVSNLWKYLCERDYLHDLKGEDIGHGSYREFYSKVLHPYGYLLGLWQMKIKEYGGFLSIEVVEGELVATQLSPPSDPKVWEPLRRKCLFKIFIDTQGKVTLHCVRGREEPHSAEIIKGKSKQEFNFKCSSPEHHKVLDMSKEFSEWLWENWGVTPDPHSANVHHFALQREKFSCLENHRDQCSFSALPPVQVPQNVPIKPGFFKGTYGGHGIEIIQLEYMGNRLRGTKVTGDPNVPAGKMSIEVHLDERIILTRDQQRTLYDLRCLDREEYILGQGQECPPQQPFSIPSGVNDRGFKKLCQEKGIPMDTCRERYAGTGLIAMPNFRSPSRTDGHFVIFNDDVFAFLWPELASISVFCRAEAIS